MHCIALVEAVFDHCYHHHAPLSSCIWIVARNLIGVRPCGLGRLVSFAVDVGLG